MSDRKHYDMLLQVRTPAELVDAIDQTADRNLVSRSAYVRTAVIERLRADGLIFQPKHRAVA